MPWVSFPGFTPGGEWTYSSQNIGSFPIWFRVRYSVPVGNYSRILLCVASPFTPREHFTVFRLFPNANYQDVIQISTPPSFNGLFRFGGKAYRYFNPANPVTLNFDFWQP